MGQSFEYFDIFNENGILIGQIGNNVFNDCESETGVFTISVADLATLLVWAIREKHLMCLMKMEISLGKSVIMFLLTVNLKR